MARKNTESAGIGPLVAMSSARGLDRGADGLDLFAAHQSPVAAVRVQGRR
jgi:hypothetical protein